MRFLLSLPVVCTVHALVTAHRQNERLRRFNARGQAELDKALAKCLRLQVEVEALKNANDSLAQTIKTQDEDRAALDTELSHQLHSLNKIQEIAAGFIAD